jgi:hypothetical protein
VTAATTADAMLVVNVPAVRNGRGLTVLLLILLPLTNTLVTSHRTLRLLGPLIYRVGVGVCAVRRDCNNLSILSVGGQALFDQQSGKYHMFEAEFTEGCNVWAALTNSIVTHSVSDSPYGPYTKSNCAICEPNAHEPSIARGPNGEWVLYFTSSKEGPGGNCPGYANPGFEHCDCTRCSLLIATVFY